MSDKEKSRFKEAFYNLALVFPWELCHLPGKERVVTSSLPPYPFPILSMSCFMSSDPLFSLPHGQLTGFSQVWPLEATAED